MGKSLQEYCKEAGQDALLDQWDLEKNMDLTPASVSWGSRKKVWWRCEKGHEWQAAISSRAGSGAGCPVCAGKVVVPGDNDFASAFPEIAREWHSTRNDDLKPDQVTLYSNRRVWWQCEMGHEWETSVAHRARGGSGCPYCAGFKVLADFNDLETLKPEIAAQWHPTLNGELTPQMVMPGSHKKVWWECSAGHAWKAMVYSRTGPRAHGCPVCAGKVTEDWQQRYVETEAADQEAKILKGNP